MDRKINIEIALSQNFNKITLGFLDEPMSYNDDDDFAIQVRQKFNVIKTLIKEQYEIKN